MKIKIAILLFIFSANLASAQWQKTSCSYTGKVRCIVNDASKIYIGTLGGGIYVSNNNGSSWSAINNGLNNMEVMAISLNNGKLFAGTLGGVYTSVDSGANWSLSNNGFPMSNIQIISLFVKNNIVYAGTWTNNGVYKTTDNGITWTQTTLQQQVSCFAETGSAIYAGTKNNYIFKSTDNFATWAQVDNNLNNPKIRDLKVMGTTIFAGTDGGGVFSSIDNGANWVERNNGFPYPYIQSLAVVGNELFAGLGGIFRSNNLGNTWKKCDHCMPALTETYSMLQIGGDIYAGTEMGLWKSTTTSILNDIEICMVGVNEANKNIIAWEKPTSSILDTVIIYREGNLSGVYDLIGKVAKNEVSEFIDSSSNPDVRSNRYRLSYNNNCAEPLEYSTTHKTMHLSINKGSGNDWNLIWDPYIGFSVTTYNIYKGTQANNLSLIASLSGANTQYTDINATASAKYYQVEVIRPGACYTSKTYTSTKSNIASNNIGGVQKVKSLQNSITLFPNPAKKSFRLILNNELENTGQLTIENIYKEVVYADSITENIGNITVSNMPSGVYMVYFETSKAIYFSRLLIID